MMQKIWHTFQCISIFDNMQWMEKFYAHPTELYSEQQTLKISVQVAKSFLRTFARNFSNIDFFLKILPSKDDELVMSEM